MNNVWFVFDLFGDMVKVTYLDIGFLALEIIAAIGFAISVIAEHHDHKDGS